MVIVGTRQVRVVAKGPAIGRDCVAGPGLTPRAMVDAVRQGAGSSRLDGVSIGYPGPTLGGRPLVEPSGLAPGWVGFDYRAAFGAPVRLVDVACLHALGAYRGGRLLWIGTGRRLAAAMIVDGAAEPIDLGPLPYLKSEFAHHLGARTWEPSGLERRARRFAAAVEHLSEALGATDVVLGGDQVDRLGGLPPGTRRGSDSDALAGGLRLWAGAAGDRPAFG